MKQANPRPKAAPPLPRWAVATGVALFGLVVIEGWMLYDWRRLALQRETVGTAAEALCLDTLKIAQQQSQAIDQLSEVAQKSMLDLQACHAVVVPSNVLESAAP